MYSCEYTSSFFRPAASHLVTSLSPRHEGNVGQAPASRDGRPVPPPNYAQGSATLQRKSLKYQRYTGCECAARSAGVSATRPRDSYLLIAQRVGVKELERWANNWGLVKRAQRDG